MAIENNLTIGESSPKKSFSGNFSTHEVLGKILVLATPILFILIWYIVASGTTPLILPSPDDVFMRLVSYFVNGRVYPHLFMTTQEILAGFVLGSILGLGFGTLISES